MLSFLTLGVFFGPLFLLGAPFYAFGIGVEKDSNMAGFAFITGIIFTVVGFTADNALTNQKCMGWQDNWPSLDRCQEYHGFSILGSP